MSVPHTIQQLVDEHEITLHCLLIKLPKISLPQRNQPVQKLKHQRRVRIALRHRYQVYVLVLHMTERCAAEREDGRADLRVRDDLDAKDVREAGAAVLTEGAEDEVLTFLIEDEDAGEHGRKLERVRQERAGSFELM